MYGFRQNGCFHMQPYKVYNINKVNIYNLMKRISSFNILEDCFSSLLITQILFTTIKSHYFEENDCCNNMTELGKNKVEVALLYVKCKNNDRLSIITYNDSQTTNYSVSK